MKQAFEVLQIDNKHRYVQNPSAIRVSGLVPSPWQRTGSYASAVSLYHANSAGYAAGLRQKAPPDMHLASSSVYGETLPNEKF